ncbi:hypothetical protein [Saccharothrix deserti]|uniref:hypothetical protein n=1 Tax=Saccharothrix deserti TaxID=2593674 RepID=UPI00192E42AB|nr:hypothetical protein [Saccharothrix deserti]
MPRPRQRALTSAPARRLAFTGDGNLVRAEPPCPNGCGRHARKAGSRTTHVYELDKPTKSYAPTGIFRDSLDLSVPFDIDIDLAKIQSNL